MVNVTSLTGNGLKDWIIQRATAVYLLLYTLVVSVVCVMHAPFNYEKWHMLFTTPWLQVSTAIALFAIVVHAWIGVWTVTTDYIKNTKVRLGTQGLVLLILIAELLGGFMTIWGN